MRYVALVYEGEADAADFGVVFPDFPGLTSSGTDYEEAVRHAAEALALRVATMDRDGDPIPAARTLRRLRQTLPPDDWEGAVAVLIPVVRGPKRLVKVSVTLEQDILDEIDTLAEARGVSRSDIVADCARAVVASP